MSNDSIPTFGGPCDGVLVPGNMERDILLALPDGKWAHYGLINGKYVYFATVTQEELDSAKD
jgi:hypothetical protein